MYGGSGAVIAENCKLLWKKMFGSLILLKDTKIKIWFDFHWNDSFSDNSYAEVRDAFFDLKNVTVVKGNISEIYKKFSNNISFVIWPVIHMNLENYY